MTDDNDPPSNWMTDLLNTVWQGVILGDSRWNPDKSCYDLADEYRKSGRTPYECVENFIDWQTTKAGAAGFVLGLPGLAFGVLTIPTDLTFTTYLQLRMVAVIALLYGWDAKSDRLKTLAMLSMLGSGAAETMRTFGVKVGSKVAANVLDKVPGHVLIQINKAVGFRLLTKAGETGAVNLIKFVPFVGGLISGGLNAVATRRIGFFADSILRAVHDGAPNQSESEMADADSQKTCPGNLNAFKRAFLEQYNPSRNQDAALQQAIRVAVQHNALYRGELTYKDRQPVRDAWSELLIGTQPKYVAAVSSEEYEGDILRLQDEMNRRLVDRLLSSGFKLSHAQKSLSVFLKHLWCMDEVAMPPQCPIDRRILRIAGVPPQEASWTAVNDIREHRAMITLLKRAAGMEPLASWELRKFRPI